MSRQLAVIDEGTIQQQAADQRIYRRLSALMARVRVLQLQRREIKQQRLSRLQKIRETASAEQGGAETDKADKDLDRRYDEALLTVQRQAMELAFDLSDSAHSAFHASRHVKDNERGYPEFIQLRNDADFCAKWLSWYQWRNKSFDPLAVDESPTDPLAFDNLAAAEDRLSQLLVPANGVAEPESSINTEHLRVRKPDLRREQFYKPYEVPPSYERLEAVLFARERSLPLTTEGIRQRAAIFGLKDEIFGGEKDAGACVYLQAKDFNLSPLDVYAFRNAERLGHRLEDIGQTEPSTYYECNHGQCTARDILEDVVHELASIVGAPHAETECHATETSDEEQRPPTPGAAHCSTCRDSKANDADRCAVDVGEDPSAIPSVFGSEQDKLPRMQWLAVRTLRVLSQAHPQNQKKGFRGRTAVKKATEIAEAIGCYRLSRTA